MVNVLLVGGGFQPALDTHFEGRGHQGPLGIGRPVRSDPPAGLGIVAVGPFLLVAQRTPLPGPAPFSLIGSRNVLNQIESN